MPAGRKAQGRRDDGDGFMNHSERNQEEPALYRDKYGDLRTLEEQDWPIKARCVDCGGHGHTRGHPRCDRCQARGYYYLPLGD